MHSKSSNYLGYTGTVRCILKKNNRVIKSTIGHNNGTSRLFEFLVRCLAGDYQVADRLRPYQIQLVDANNEPLTDVKPCIRQQPDFNDNVIVLSFILDSRDWKATSGSDSAKKLQLQSYMPDESNTGKYAVLAEYILDSETDVWGNPGIWTATTSLLVDWQLELLNYNQNIESD